MKRFLTTAVVALMGLTVWAQVPTVPTVPSSPYRDPAKSESGFWWGAGLSLGISAHHSHGIVGTVYPFEGSAVAGWRFSDFLQAGLGFGVRYYGNNDAARWQEDGEGGFEDYPWAFPIFADLRGALLSGHSRDIVPAWNLEAGYAINDGLFVSPMIGLRALVGDGVRHHVTFGIGRVLTVRPMGGDTLYEIAFESVGTKKLMATFAKLKKVD